jgi:hypothetical protein
MGNKYRKEQELVTFKDGKWNVNNKEKRESVEKILAQMSLYAKTRAAEIEKILEGTVTAKVHFRLDPKT